jgi:NADPH-dependent ferric siderophore reductase
VEDDINYYRAEVRAVSRVTPNMIRIIFAVTEPDTFASTGFADERLAVAFPRSERAGGPNESAQRRSYTVRAWDRATGDLTIDFVVHAGGVAAQWALRAKAGDVVQVSDALGWYDPPADSEWQLLVADMTGLPALGRIVENLPAGIPAHVIVETIDAADRQQLESAAEVSYQWLSGTGHGHTPSVLASAVRRFDLPPGRGYVWFAGEAAESRVVRKYLRHSLGWPVERFEVLGYWRVRKEEWMARYDQLGGELEKIYTEAVAKGRSTDVALELYEEALEKVGL